MRRDVLRRREHRRRFEARTRATRESTTKRTPPTRRRVGGEMILKLTRLLGSSATATQHQNARTGEDGQRGRLGDGNGLDEEVVISDRNTASYRSAVDVH